MLEKFASKMSYLSSRWVPDPFVLALLLTLLTLALGTFFGKSLGEASIDERLTIQLEGWSGFFFSTGLMKFAMQMCFVLVTGHALALSRPVQLFVVRLTRIPKTSGQAAALVALTACTASIIHWGLGAIVGALIAREMGRAARETGLKLHYPLLGAAAYAGFMLWHGGLSGSAPLKVAESGHFLEASLGVVPITETVFSWLNLAVTGSLILLVPLICVLFTPKDERKFSSPPVFADDRQEFSDLESKDNPLWVTIVSLAILVVIIVVIYGPIQARHKSYGALVFELLCHGVPLFFLVRFMVARLISPRDKQEPNAMDNSRWLSFLIGVLGLTVVELGLVVNGFALTFDTVNFLFLFLGIILQETPIRYVRAVSVGVRGAAGIILQFPFYFGILGLLKSSGLIHQVADFFVNISTESTFPVFTFLSAALVNMFVPSGGGQWAVQGEILAQAGARLGSSPTTTIMAFSYGDAWTNMIQPFWSLPLLGIMGLRARDIIGYTTAIMFLTGPVILFWLLVLG